jgi:hypothetical protein
MVANQAKTEKSVFFNYFRKWNQMDNFQNQAKQPVLVISEKSACYNRLSNTNFDCSLTSSILEEGMSNKRKVVAFVESLGGTVEDNSDSMSHDYNIDAPAGFIWSGAGLHGIVASTYRGPWGTKDMWEDAWDCIKDGVERCEEIPHCDICLPED